MPNKKLLLAAVAALVLLGAGIVWYRHRVPSDAEANRADLLGLMPTESSAVAFVDLAALRNAPFLNQLLALAPKPTADSDYAEFVRVTDFDYERDLDRAAIAWNRDSKNATTIVVVEGRFDRKKIENYASQFGSLKTADGKTLFAVPVNGSARKAYFVFLRDDRVALANDSSYFFQRPRNNLAGEWREHFERVAGTPLFALLRQDSLSASALAQAPGAFRSPQLASLLAQLQWISITGKPEGNLLRVVIDGESLTEAPAHQLKELLSGLVVLAQMGLNDPKTRKQLDPELREGYLELLQSADIQQLDRGTNKSVRVVLDVTPKLLDGARGTASEADPPAPQHAR